MNNQEFGLEECLDAAHRVVAMAEAVAARARLLARAVEHMRATINTVAEINSQFDLSWGPQEERLLRTLL